MQQDVKITLGRIVVLVGDYDEAFNVYKNALNARKISDQLSLSGQRYFHIGFEEQCRIGQLVSKSVDARRKELCGKTNRGQPFFVLYTNL